MRNPTNWIILAFVGALAVFSVIVVWPDMPKRYLPDFIDWPSGNGLKIGGFEREEMRLGLDLKGGSFVLLEVEDINRLPPGTDLDNALEGVKDVLERRINAFGTSETEITREGALRLAVQMPGIDPEQARELLGKTAQLEFREPLRDEAGDIVCRAEDGSEFSVPPQQVTSTTIDDRRVSQCLSADAAGEVVWEPAMGTDSQGVERVLTGAFLRPNADVVGPPPTVVIEFTGEGGLLFEQITGRLVGFPLGIFLDDELVAAPTVQQAITGSNSTITGLDFDEARTLTIQLNAGALPAPLRVISIEETP